MNNFEGKVAVVTGGAQGIGRCIADEFQRNGASVCIIDCQKALILWVTCRTNSRSSVSRTRLLTNTGTSII